MLQIDSSSSLLAFPQDSLWLHRPFSDSVLLHVVTRVLSYPSCLFESRQPVSCFPAIFSSHPFPTQSECDECALTRAPRVTISTQHPQSFCFSRVLFYFSDDIVWSLNICFVGVEDFENGIKSVFAALQKFNSLT